MLGGEYNWIMTSKLANQHAPKALFTCVVYTGNNNYFDVNVKKMLHACFPIV